VRYWTRDSATAHLGVAKTIARASFYWPGITSDANQFCGTCDVYQRLGKGGLPAVAR